MNSVIYLLAWSLVHFLWQALLIFLLAKVSMSVLRGAGAGIRYVVSYTALVLMAVSFVGTFLYLDRGEIPLAVIPNDTELALIDEVSSGGVIESPAEVGKETTLVESVTHSVISRVDRRWPDWKMIVVGVWGFGVLMLSLRHALGLWSVFNLRRSCHLPTESLNQNFKELCVKMKVMRNVMVRVSEKVKVPVVVGVIKPMVLIPVCVLSGLSKEQLSSILAHELAHIRRHDYLANLIQTALETLLFFHPCVWWVSAMIRKEREYVCDERALEVCGDKIIYAKALSELAHVSGPKLAMAAGSGKGELHKRISLILGVAPVSRSGSGVVSIAVACAMVFVALGSMPQSAQASEDEGQKLRGGIQARDGRYLAKSTEEGRIYPYGALASHVIGYTQRVKQVPGLERGAAGLEKTADHILKEKDLKVTLDLDIQYIVESVLREKGVGRGAVVILDVSDGDVLAMASVPSSDPNDGIPFLKKKKLKEYMNNKANPLLNRATRLCSPGSTAMIATALAIGEGTYSCKGSILINGVKLRCWRQNGHGVMTLGGAIEKSCNCYFYQGGIKTGSNRLLSVFQDCGLGEKTGVELPREDTGRLPKAKLTGGQRAMLSVGQGEFFATPLQMAALAGMVANNGEYYSPRLFKNRTKVAARHVKVDPEVLKIVRDAMVSAVSDADGTLQRAKSEKIQIAGKSGTSQTIRTSDRAMWEHDGWFVGFTPVDKPKYAFAVIIEGVNSGGKTAVPLARMILERIEEYTGAKKLEVKPLEPMKGHMNKVTEIK